MSQYLEQAKKEYETYVERYGSKDINNSKETMSRLADVWVTCGNLNFPYILAIRTILEDHDALLQDNELLRKINKIAKHKVETKDKTIDTLQKENKDQREKIDMYENCIADLVSELQKYSISCYFRTTTEGELIDYFKNKWGLNGNKDDEK